jgi:fatty-acyl-CoA synthase
VPLAPRFEPEDPAWRELALGPGWAVDNATLWHPGAGVPSPSVRGSDPLDGLDRPLVVWRCLAGCAAATVGVPVVAPSRGIAVKVPLTVVDFLRRAEQVYGDRIAVIDEPDQPAESWGSLTWKQVAERARAQAAGLDALGIAQGERVAMISHNSARLLTAFYGVSGSGRILVPINFRLVAEEVQYIVNHSGARILLIDPELEEAMAGVTCERKMIIGAESDAVLYHYGVIPAPWEPDEDATATINYTSGTTARPKGVQLTHRNVWLNATTFGWQSGVNDRDVYLHTLPQFHCNGWGMVYGVTGMGGTHIIIRKIDGAEILNRVAKHGVTYMCAAPAVLAAVLDAAAKWDGPIPGFGTTRVTVAGAPPPSRLIERVETELGWELMQIYGLTETSPLLTMNRNRAEYDHMTPAERAVALSRAGAPALGVEIKISESGEVTARSNVVMDGYWAQPEATAEAIQNGFFHTGDGGAVDEVGGHYLSIQDRKKDVIITGGENVSSIEVEDACFQHPDVTEVAVIGVPDAKWGEAVMALVVTVPGSTLTEAELIAFTKTKLAGYKCPKRIEFRPELARTATGKLQKFKLRAPYWEGFVRQVN